MRTEDTEGSGGSAEAPGRARAARLLRASSIFIALFVIGLALSFASPYFFTTNNLLNVLLQAATISIISAGFTVVLIGGEIDLSIGSAIGLTASVVSIMIIREEMPVAVGIVLALCVGLALGLFNGYVTVFFRIPSFVVTLATLGIAHGAGLLLTAGRPVAGFPDSYRVIGQELVGPVPVPIIVAACVYAMLYFLLNRTSFGIPALCHRRQPRGREAGRRSRAARLDLGVRHQRHLWSPGRHRAELAPRLRSR